MLADSCAIGIVNRCRNFKWGQWYFHVSHAKEAVSNPLLEPVLGLGESVSFPATPKTTVNPLTARGQLFCFRHGCENTYSLNPREDWMHIFNHFIHLLQGKTSTRAGSIIICGSLERQSFAKLCTMRCFAICLWLLDIPLQGGGHWFFPRDLLALPGEGKFRRW